MKIEISAGTILISKPFMEDKRFDKTIILLTQHDEEGTIGLIINRLCLFNPKDIIPELNSFNIKIKEGGPVEKDKLFFIHKHPNIIKDSKKIKNELYFGGDFDKLINGINQKQILVDDVLFFIGYAGWDKYQLNDEIQDGSWILYEINDLNKIFKQIDWSSTLVEINQEYKVWANAPTDFHLN
ncbi:MAG: transcriptional regulator [Flavobacteriales bacterium]|nr:transcriptional regulator [Flavobacteriales bacterium]|tara:strand:+ start:8578 stop:9126 length:549 start_codon:yes stop_codon:yes gene_type:complete